MSSSIQLLLWIALAALLGYLYEKHRQRTRALIEREERESRPGRGLDAGMVAKRLKALRRDYLKELDVRSRSTAPRRGWVAAARKVIRRMAYFHDLDSRQPLGTDKEGGHAEG